VLNGQAPCMLGDNRIEDRCRLCAGLSGHPPYHVPVSVLCCLSSSPALPCDLYILILLEPYLHLVNTVPINLLQDVWDP
jgi:hypothetical protein